MILINTYTYLLEDSILYMAYKTKYKINNKDKYIGNPSNIICRSLWERRVCKYLDENVNVLKWGSEELSIPYYSPIDKKNHKYFPDFIVKMKNKNESTKTVIIEVIFFSNKKKENRINFVKIEIGTL